MNSDRSKPREWPARDVIEAALDAAQSLTGAAEALDVPRTTLDAYCRREGVALPRPSWSRVLLVPAPQVDTFADDVHALIRKRKQVSIEDLADALDVPPRRVREALGDLRARGYRVPEEMGQVAIGQVDPDKTNLHRSLLDGDVIRVGVVSDTHLCSNEQALAELELAYDTFEEEGISEVWHAGDFCAGVGIFPTQHNEIFRHTFEAQVDYLAEHYPRRKGIVTRGIAGNHDIEGQFGRVGANPVVALANRRDDIEYLGDYSAWVQLPNGAWVHLLHGKGGMSYSFSYKAQKLAAGYRDERKPAALFVGHWHVTGWIEAHGVQVVFPGCFEWKSKFLERLGLSPSVGFWIAEMTLGDDGELVQFAPRLLRFREGRRIAA